MALILGSAYAGAALAWLAGIDAPFEWAALLLGFAVGFWLQCDDRPETFIGLARLTPPGSVGTPVRPACSLAAAVLFAAPGWRPRDAVAMASGAFVAAYVLSSAARGQPDTPLAPG